MINTDIAAKLGQMRKIAALTFAVLAICAWAPCLALANKDAELFEKLKVFSMVVNEIQEKFVEQPDNEEILNGAIQGMLSTLDPHSSYMTVEEFKDFQQEAQGSFFGVGIEITLRDGVPTVVSPIEGTPAYKAGIMAGDQIIKIDDKATKDMTLNEAVKLIRGDKGTKVKFTISREGAKSFLDYSVIRDLIPIKSVRWEMLEPGYGYMRISSFQGDTFKEAVNALKELTDLKGLILDVRNDPGGLLDQSIEISGLFLGQELVVETKGRIVDQNVRYKAQSKMMLPADCPIVVLVNEGSASASEIVAGALQDHKRALVVGAKSFGKGSVQTVLPLRDGSGIRLTTARFYTPSGRSIQADGITPDVLVPSRLPPEVEVIREADLDRHLVGVNEKPKDKNAKKGGDAKKDAAKDKNVAEAPEFEMPDRPLSEMPLEERLKFDPQLEKALTLLKTDKVPNKFISSRK